MMRFFDFLFPPRVDETVLREVSLDEFLALLAPRSVSMTRPNTIALLPFSDAKVRAAIHEAKYHGSEEAFQLLAGALVEYLRDSDERLCTPCIVPVPLGKGRHRERGFNQVHEVVLRALRSLGEEGEITIDATLLKRVHETTSQVSLPRHSRAANMRGAFRAVRPVDPACTYIIIDDVITTGATLQAAIDALVAAGAKHIISLALAH